MLVVVDEAQLFAPAIAGEVSDEARKLSLGAMTNLMCRGRKRGLAGVIATQRLAKLAKNVAAEASNFLMGRTFLDIDMAARRRPARHGAAPGRNVPRPRIAAISLRSAPPCRRSPLPVRIGPVASVDRGGAPSLMPLPEQAPEDASKLIFTAGEDEVAPAPWPKQPRPRPVVAPEIIRRIETHQPVPPPEPEIEMDPEERAAALVEILNELLDDPEARDRPVAVLYQDFTVRCRMRRVSGPETSLDAFRKRLAVARAGASEEVLSSDAWEKALTAAETLPEDLHGLFLFIARSAIEGGALPLRCRTGRSLWQPFAPSRARRLIGYIEERGLLVCHVDFRGQRTLALPALGVETAPGLASPLVKGLPPRRARG
jgi:hypothetical protein